MENEIGTCFTVSKIIGKGAFSTVYKGFHKIINQVVAIKKININQIMNSHPKESAHILQNIDFEINLLRTLKHPNIIGFHDFIKTTDNWYIILEYCERGDLSKTYKRLSEKTIKKYMRELANVLQYLRENNIVHRDIKPQNILVTSDNSIKLTDFNFARELYNDDLATTYCGTPLYMAPEIVSPSGQNQEGGSKPEGYTAQSDLWSIGILLYEMAYGYNPLGAANNMKHLIILINTTEISFNNIIHFSEEGSRMCIDLLEGLLEKNVEKRITWDEFFNHEFLAPIGAEQETDEFIVIIYKALYWAKENWMGPLISSEKLENYINLINTNKINNIQDISFHDLAFIINVSSSYYNSLLNCDTQDLEISELKFYVTYTIQKLEILASTSGSGGQGSILQDDSCSESEIHNIIPDLKGRGQGSQPIKIISKTQENSLIKKQDVNDDFIIVDPGSDTIRRSETYPPLRNLSTPRRVANSMFRKMNRSYNTIKDVIKYVSTSRGSNSY